jgi:hypothetical protein
MFDRFARQITVIGQDHLPFEWCDEKAVSWY